MWHEFKILDQDHPKEEGDPDQEADLKIGLLEGIDLGLEKGGLKENPQKEEDLLLVKDQCLKKEDQGLDLKDDLDRVLHPKTETDQQVVLVRTPDPDPELLNEMVMVTMTIKEVVMKINWIMARYDN